MHNTKRALRYLGASVALCLAAAGAALLIAEPARAQPSAQSGQYIDSTLGQPWACNRCRPWAPPPAASACCDKPAQTQQQQQGITIVVIPPASVVRKPAAPRKPAKPCEPITKQVMVCKP